MDQNEIKARIADLEKQIAALPAGSVTKKMIRGKLYFYHRWTENKKRREKYIPAGEEANFRSQIQLRKTLEKERKALLGQLEKETVRSFIENHSYQTVQRNSTCRIGNS